MYSNFWLSQFNLSNIGGIIGIGLNISNPEVNAFWYNSTAWHFQFAVSLIPTENNWGWIPGAPNKTSQNSYIYFGGIDPTLLQNELSGNINIE